MKVLIDGIDAYDTTYEKIKEAWSVLKNAVNYLEQKKAMRFRPGMTVTFISRKVGFVNGVVIKVNQKSVTVKADSGVTWNVSPGLLTEKKK